MLKAFMVISVIMFVIGYGMFVGGGIACALSNGEEEVSDNYFDTTALLGGLSTIIFIVCLVIKLILGVSIWG